MLSWQLHNSTLLLLYCLPLLLHHLLQLKHTFGQLNTRKPVCWFALLHLTKEDSPGCNPVQFDPHRIEKRGRNTEVGKKTQEKQTPTESTPSIAPCSCSPHLEHLIIIYRPLYVPQEFGSYHPRLTLYNKKTTSSTPTHHTCAS